MQTKPSPKAPGRPRIGRERFTVKVYPAVAAYLRRLAVENGTHPGFEVERLVKKETAAL